MIQALVKPGVRGLDCSVALPGAPKSESKLPEQLSGAMEGMVEALVKVFHPAAQMGGLGIAGNVQREQKIEQKEMLEDRNLDTKIFRDMNLNLTRLNTLRLPEKPSAVKQIALAAKSDPEQA